MSGRKGLLALLCMALACVGLPAGSRAPSVNVAPPEVAPLSADPATFLEPPLDDAAPPPEVEVLEAPSQDVSTEVPAGPDGESGTWDSFVPGVSVELASERSQLTRTWEQPDGTRLVESSTWPLHWLSDGEWLTIDPSLDEIAPGVFRSGSNSWSVTFDRFDIGYTISQGTADLRFEPVGAAAVTPELTGDGNAVVYRDVWPNVDAVYTVTPVGVKEDLVLKAMPDRDSFRFRTHGTIFALIDGLLTTTIGGVQGVLSPAQTFDADGVMLHDAAELRPLSILESVLPSVAVDVDLDQLAGLDSAAWPVTVDPAWTDAGYRHAHSVRSLYSQSSGGPATVYGNPDGIIRLGNAAPPGVNQVWRSDAYFNVADVRGYYINSARVVVYNHAFGTTGSFHAGLTRVNGNGWANIYPGGGWASNPALRQATDRAPVTDHYDVTGFVQAGANNNATTRRFGFVGQETWSTHTYTYKGFQTATLWIYYDPDPPATPTITSPTNGRHQQSTSISTTVRNNDSRHAYLAVHLLDASGTVINGKWCGGSNPVAVNPGATCTVTMNATGQGHFRVRAIAEDPDRPGNQFSSWTPLRQVTVDWTGPTVSHSVSWPIGASESVWRPFGWSWVVWYANDNTATTSDPSSTVVGYSMAWTKSPTTTVNTSFNSGWCDHSEAPNAKYAFVPGFTSDCAADTSNLSGDGAWYLHVRARDKAGNWGPTAHFGPHYLDRTGPTTPTGGIACADPSAGSGPSLTAIWAASSDGYSGVGGYSWVWTQDTAEVPDGTAEAGPNVHTATSDPLPDGTWYFKVAALDQAEDFSDPPVNNMSAVETLGPIEVENGAVTSGTGTTFADLWLSRVTDQGFMDNFLSLAEIPQDILDEGFHDSTADQQAALSMCLLRQVLTPAEFDALTPEERDLEAGLLELKIFEPQLLQSELGPVVNNVESVVSAPTETIDDLAAQLLGGGVLDVPGLLDPTGDPLIPASELEALLEGLGDVASLDDLAVPAEVIETVGTPVFDTVDQTHALVDAIADEVGIGEVTGPILDLIVGLIESGKYRLCWESASVDPTCTGDLVQGVPVTVDLSGDGTDDVRADVTIGLPVSSTVPVSYGLERLASSEMATGSMPFHVWLAYDVPGTSSRVNLGYDGYHPASSLADETVLSADLDVTAFGSGDLGVDVDLTHTGAPSQWALTLDRVELDSQGDEFAPTRVAASFAPVPNTVDGRVDYRSGSVDELQFTLNSATAATVIVDTLQETTTTNGVAARDTSTTVVDQLPAALDVTASLGGDAVQRSGQLNVTASAPISLISYRGVTTPDVSVPGQNTTTTASITDLQSASATVDIGATTASISASSGTAVGRLTFSTETTDSSGVARSIAARAAGLPTSVDINLDQNGTDGLTASYSANSAMDALDLALFDRDAATTLAGSITDLPAAVTVTKAAGQPRMTVDAPGGAGQLDTSLVIGNAPVIDRPGPIATLNIPSDGNIAARVRVANLEHVEAAIDESARTGTGSVGFAQPGQDLTVDVVHKSQQLRLYLDDLPATASATVDLDDPNVTYQASGPITGLQAYATDTQTGPTVATAVTDVPAQISADFTEATSGTEGQPATLAYTADSPTGAVTAWYTPGHATVLDPETMTHLLASVHSVPASVVVTVDDDPLTLDYTASGTTGQVAASMRGMIPDLAQAVAIASLADMPTQWNATIGDNYVDVAGVTGPIGPIFFAGSTDGTLPAVRPGHHVQIGGSVSAGDIRGSLHLPGITHAHYDTADGGLTASLETTHTASPLELVADLTLPVEGSTSDNFAIIGTAQLAATPASVSIASLDGSLDVNLGQPIAIGDISLKIGWIPAVANLGAVPAGLNADLYVSDAGCDASDGCQPETDTLCKGEDPDGTVPAGAECYAVQIVGSIPGAPSRITLAENPMLRVDDLAQQDLAVDFDLQRILGPNTTIDGRAQIEQIPGGTDFTLHAAELISFTNLTGGDPDQPETKAVGADITLTSTNPIGSLDFDLNTIATDADGTQSNLHLCTAARGIPTQMTARIVGGVGDHPAAGQGQITDLAGQPIESGSYVGISATSPTDRLAFTVAPDAINCEDARDELLTTHTPGNTPAVDVDVAVALGDLPAGMHLYLPEVSFIDFSTPPGSSSGGDDDPDCLADDPDGPGPERDRVLQVDYVASSPGLDLAVFKPAGLGGNGFDASNTFLAVQDAATDLRISSFANHNEGVEVVSPSGGTTSLVALSLSFAASISALVNHDVDWEVGPARACLDAFVNIDDLDIGFDAVAVVENVADTEIGLVDARVAGVVDGQFGSLDLTVTPDTEGLASVTFDARLRALAEFHASVGPAGGSYAREVIDVGVDDQSLTVDGVAPIVLWPRAAGDELLVCADWDPPDTPPWAYVLSPAGAAAYDLATHYRSFRVGSSHQWRQFEPSAADNGVLVELGAGGEGPYIVGFLNPISEFTLDSVWGEAADRLGFERDTSQPGPLLPSWLNAYAVSRVAAYPGLDSVSIADPYLSTDQCP